MAQTRPPDIARLAIPIAVIFFSWGFGTRALWVTRPLFAASFSVSLVYVGLISSLSAAPRMVSGPITGFLADRWGRRPMIYAGAITQGSVLVLQFFSTSYLQYALLEVVAGLGIAFWTVSSGVLVADVTAVGNRGRSVAFRNTAQRLGMLAGPVVGGLIATAFGLRWVFIFIALTKVPVIITTLFFIPETRPDHADRKEGKPTAQEHPSPEPPRGSSLTMFRSRAFAALVAATVAFGMIGVGPGVFRTYFPIHAQEAGALTPAAIGNLMGITALITIALALPTGALIDRYGRKRMVILGLAATAASTYLLGGTVGFVTALAAVAAFGLAEGVNSNAIQTYAMDLAPRDRRGVFLGVYHLTMNIGQVIGPLGAGLLASLVGLETTLYIFAGIVVGCGLLYMLLSRETLRREPDRETIRSERA